ncbi:MAG: hypothetical protein DMG04_18090 [Acidobacteria bacterium]|nr:MAG: hypothetical protein DMG04_18090 [Acidobacteriota bacterium]PYQ86373.1 MAG: hypothetical protein DMG02_25185 [Acidobacteriota bacterium]PYR07448.1 MAG: hypothetical protein DMF99_22760 [Acidobacteriota bacterium]
MKHMLCVGFALAAVIAIAVPLRAHHAFAAEFDIDKPINLRGTVTVMEWVNPHSWIHIDVKGVDRAVVNWMVEGGSPNQLMRLGFTKNAILPGMEIVVDGYQAKDGTNKAVGRSLMFADGRKFLLGNMEPAGRGGPQR